MIQLDTDTLSLFSRGDPRVAQRVQAATDTVGTTVVARIEVLRARFDFLMKAADGDQLQRAQNWLEQSEKGLRHLPIMPVNVAAAAEFDRLRQDKKLRKIGRADLLIACIALARQATLVNRNLKHFRQVPNLKVENWAE
jgi:tRNA(fMet)-specific endonuclease VapC